MKEKPKVNNVDIIPVNQGESFDSYRQRIYKLKEQGVIDLTWAEISRLFADTFNIKRDESKWRKEAKELIDISNDKRLLTNDTIESMEDPQVYQQQLIDIQEALLEYRKERVKISDERTQNNAYIRRMAREETLIEMAKVVATEMSSKKILTPRILPLPKTDKKQELIVQLSDWHYGIEVDNFLNKFNPEICIQRVSKLLEVIIRYIHDHPVQKIYVVNLGDLIAGRIHNTIRLESRYDIVTQCIHVSEVLAEFLQELSAYAPIEYFDCLDNHSRLEPVKTDSLELESLARITPWYLKDRLKDHRVHINTNVVNDDIITFTVMDDKFTVGGVHGHKDKPVKVVDNLTLLTKISFDLILTAHLHHFSCDEKNETLVVSNGSVMGTDRYAMDLRLTSKPSQNIILVNEHTVADHINRITLE